MKLQAEDLVLRSPALAASALTSLPQVAHFALKKGQIGARSWSSFLVLGSILWVFSVSS